jgi:nitrite reductase/ring-hydroxylating ferredoxin subunit
MTMEWQPLCKIADVESGKSKQFEVKEKKILVSNIDGKFYAMDALCSHMGAHLENGKNDGKDIICPRHHARFNIQTGKVDKNINGLFKAMTRKEAHDLNSYEIKETDGELSINL